MIKYSTLLVSKETNFNTEGTILHILGWQTLKIKSPVLTEVYIPLYTLHSFLEDVFERYIKPLKIRLFLL